MGRVVAWLPRVWQHVNQFLESRCTTADVTIGSLRRFNPSQVYPLTASIHPVLRDLRHARKSAQHIENFTVI